MIRIHGTNDKLLPLRDDDVIKIADGGHFMIVEQAAEVSMELNNII